jgi:hypothetical protein
MRMRTMREPTGWKTCSCPCDCNDLERVGANGEVEYAKAYMRELEETILMARDMLEGMSDSTGSVEQAFYILGGDDD